MPTAVERIIANLPKESSVMDVGYGGLDGVNTTNFLRAHFGKIDGINKTAYAVEKYKIDNPSAKDDEVTIGVYPHDMPGKRYDLLVLDPGIEGSLQFWSLQGMEIAWQFVNDGGHILKYIMLTDFYGDPATQEMIKEHRAGWWAKGIPLPIVQQEFEEARDYIAWVLLKKP
jgi:hypothetical protein